VEARTAHDFAAVVDVVCDATLAAEYRHHAVSPNARARRSLRIGLGIADDLATVVNGRGITIAARRRREIGQTTITPEHRVRYRPILVIPDPHDFVAVVDVGWKKYTEICDPAVTPQKRLTVPVVDTDHVTAIVDSVSHTQEASFEVDHPPRCRRRSRSRCHWQSERYQNSSNDPQNASSEYTAEHHTPPPDGESAACAKPPDISIGASRTGETESEDLLVLS
jgi:hypothetical protein